ncbi:MAG: DUF2793 domain-containing protein [Pseudomonadota bacterium]
MSELSPRLGMPYIQPSQAQKHVTHNEALRVLDTLVQLRISAFDAVTPPTSPDLGSCFALGADPELDWAGQDGRVAVAEETGWRFVTPDEGWVAWDQTSSQLRVYSGGVWTPHSAGGAGADQVAQLGVGTAADPLNKLSVASDATLFSHAGAGHQMKLNKASSTETASLLFQSAWTGHAEMGLAGDTAFSIKISDDGVSWIEALRADPASQSLDWAPDGTVRMTLGAAALTVNVPVTGSAVQADATDTTPGRLMLAQHGYGPGNVLGTVAESGGVPTGAVVERGQTANGEYVRFADGTQICTISVAGAVTPNAAIGSIYRGSSVYAWTYPAVFANANVHVTCSARSASAVWGKGRTTGSVTGELDIYSATPIGSALTIDGLAIGRWF